MRHSELTHSALVANSEILNPKISKGLRGLGLRAGQEQARAVLPRQISDKLDLLNLLKQSASTLNSKVFLEHAVVFGLPRLQSSCLP